MHVVIDIPDEIYETLKKCEVITSGLRGGKTFMSKIYTAVANGTPLPKGHGDLIDKGAYRKEFLNSRDFEPMKILDFQPVIVKADKEE